MPSESVAASQARAILERITTQRTLHEEEGVVHSGQTAEGDVNETPSSSSSTSSASASTTTVRGQVSDTNTVSITDDDDDDDDDDACNRYDVYVLKRSSVDAITGTDQQRYHVERRTI